MYLNKIKYILILTAMLFSCKQNKLIQKDDIYLLHTQQFSCMFEFKIKHLIEIEGHSGLMLYKEFGRWEQIKDTLFFYQKFNNKQNPAFTLISEKYDKSVLGTSIKILNTKLLENKSLIFMRINDVSDEQSKLFNSESEYLCFPDTFTSVINITTIRFNETYIVSGNIFEFEYNNPEIIEKNYILPNKYLIKKNTLIPLNKNGELEGFPILKKIK